jgi:hypothetical protein
MTGSGHEPEEASSVLARARPLIGEAHALCYALVMALSSTSREELTREEIDALCQVAYELLNKLNEALDCFDGSSELPAG